MQRHTSIGRGMVLAYCLSVDYPEKRKQFLTNLQILLNTLGRRQAGDYQPLAAQVRLTEGMDWNGTAHGTP